jgi:hypothetical protein
MRFGRSKDAWIITMASKCRDKTSRNYQTLADCHLRFHSRGESVRVRISVEVGESYQSPELSLVNTLSHEDMCIYWGDLVSLRRMELISYGHSVG